MVPLRAGLRGEPHASVRQSCHLVGDAVRFDSEASLNTLLRGLAVRKRELSFEAAFMAGLAHGRYRRAGGVRERTLPDFLIGAHAAHEDHTLLTRDPARYRTYFPDLALIAPDTHP